MQVHPFSSRPFLLVAYNNLVECLGRFCMLGNEFNAKHIQPEIGHFADQNNCSFEIAPQFRRFLGHSGNKHVASFLFIIGIINVGR